MISSFTPELFFGIFVDVKVPLLLHCLIFLQVYLLAGYYYTATGEYDIKWTMPHCVLTLKLVGMLTLMVLALLCWKNPIVSEKVDVYSPYFIVLL